MDDFFISYTQSDREWAFWLAKELEALGHRPHIHEWEIEGGENIYAWMETRIDAAHHMLCVVSEEYLKAPYSTLERRAGLWHAAKEQPGFVLLVQVKPCRLPRLSANISRCNLVGKPREIASKQFREFIAERKPPETVNDPFRDVYAATNIPIRVPTHFMGRDEPLAAIAAALGRYEGRVARRLDAIALALVGSDSEPADGAESTTSYLLDRLASYRQAALGAYASARPLFERALAIREKALGPDHRSTATILNNLALLVQAQGELAAARPLFERARAILEKVLSPDHPDTATSLDNLARVLRAQGELAAARPLFERALAICEKVLGVDHPDTGRSLNNLAGLLQDQGELAAARPLYERTLAIYEKALGPDHPDTAKSLNNLARLLQAQGELAPAGPLFERALAICEKALGAEHPNTARARSNYARLLLAGGEPARAVAPSEAALAAHDRALGPEHPWTKDSARAAAEALAALGRVAEADSLRARHGLDAAADPAEAWSAATERSWPPPLCGHGWAGLACLDDPDTATAQDNPISLAQAGES